MMSAAQKYDVFQAIADPSRRKMLKLLANQELPVTMISHHFPMSRTAVSKHLNILLESNLVSVEKVGREKRYKLQPDALLELKHWLSFYEQFWDNKLSMLKHLVENEETDELKVIDSKRTNE
ncbi:ArsR/SmtB family transcription factor [Metabacillus sediminilitoris]|uniref:Winged helix-turn-helix transcriptional regulator n=1 Tax=Metabacillus sediminilitoris TaxID=2567941 RepID=A0A4S4C044_9BACI|nr:metalloregulator ArsR/SmtB family transcription factor [Metabacillus sediminilitoris]QGQ47975.1 metalloregulator ArsR/SmtB family transcription factor [Metabacillus sediminilitoris]THF80911.1 winged helix-turn-helix transcriptional regulator [Metabacillus sediminilitoris]